MKFYRCKHCNDIIKVENKIEFTCCNKQMEELIPESVDAVKEKHIPVVEIAHDIVVTVGEVEHPMTEEHYIKWILVELENGYMVTNLKPNEKPIARFQSEQKIKAVYAYCNLHALWKVEF